MKPTKHEKTTSGAVVFEPTDPTPMAVPVNLRKPESMDARIARILAHSNQKALDAAGFETFEEADDFDIPDDPIDALTPWEQDFDLAAIQAIDGGVTQRPQVSSDSHVKARNILGIFRDFIKEKTGDRRAEEFKAYYHNRTSSPAPKEVPKSDPDE